MPDTTTVQDILSICERFDLPITIADPEEPDCPFIFANKRFLRLTGHSAQDITGQSYRLLQGKDTEPHVYERMSKACARRAKHTCCMVNYRKDGSGFNNLLTIEPIEVSRNKTLVLGCLYPFEQTVTRKQVRFQMQYLNVMLRSVYRASRTDQKLLANADVLRMDGIISRSDNAFFLVCNHLTRIRTLQVIRSSQELIDQTRDLGLSMNTPRRSA